MELGWILQRSHYHTLLQKQMELMKAVCLDPLDSVPHPLCCTPLAPRYSLSLSLWHTAFTVIVSLAPDPLTLQILHHSKHIVHIYKLFQQCLCLSFPAEFHKIHLIKPDIILEGKKIKLMAFVYKETTDNNKMYHGNGTWLDYFLQMYSQSGVRYCSL